MQQGSTTPASLKKVAPTAVPSLFPDDAQCLAALKTKRVDAYVIDQGILISNASTDDTLKVVGEPFSDDYYGIGLTRDDPTAKQFVDRFLTTIFENGAWLKMWQATIGTVVTGEQVAHGKPHPEPYLEAARRLGVDPAACVALEDSPTGAASATAAGVPTLVVPHVVEVPEIPGAVRVGSLAGLHAEDLLRLARAESSRLRG